MAELYDYDNTCRSCRHWDLSGYDLPIDLDVLLSTIDGDKKFRCVRFPPTVVKVEITGKSVQAYPETESFETCGEHQRRPADQMKLLEETKNERINERTSGS